MIIGIAGKAGSGKDTAANFLTQCRGFKQIAFATPIKEALQVMFDVEIETLERTHGKDDIIPLIGTSLRKLYQTLGTDWGREMISEDIWIAQARRWLTRYIGHDIVFSDVRFENEAAFIRDQGGTMIHVFANNVPTTREHSSEYGIEVLEDDIRLMNPGTLQTYCNKLGALIEDIRHGTYEKQAS